MMIDSHEFDLSCCIICLGLDELRRSLRTTALLLPVGISAHGTNLGPTEHSTSNTRLMRHNTIAWVIFISKRYEFQVCNIRFSYTTGCRTASGSICPSPGVRRLLFAELRCCRAGGYLRTLNSTYEFLQFCKLFSRS